MNKKVKIDISYIIYIPIRLINRDFNISYEEPLDDKGFE